MDAELAEIILSGKRKRKAKKSPAVPRRAPSAGLESAVESLVAAVTEGDDESRGLVVSHLLKTCLPPTVALLCGRLARRSGRLPAARAALVLFGRAAVPAVNDALRRAGDREGRVALAGVADEIGATLPVRDRVAMMEELMITRRLCRSKAVSGAAGGAIAGLRQVDR